MNDYIITCYDELAIWLGNNVDLMKEIVRCRDCKYLYGRQCGRNLDWFDVEFDDFCAWGERK